MKEEKRQRQLELAEELLKEQNLGAAVVAGAIATILGCGVYSVAALLAGGQSVSVLVIAIGAAVGIIMQYLGRGITAHFSLAAAAFGIASYPLARLCTIALYTSKAERISIFELLNDERLFAMWAWVFTGIRLIDLIFWVAAAGTAAYLSRRRLSRDEDEAIYTFVHR